MVGMPDSRVTIDQVNRMGQEEFVALLGAVFEHSPWVAEAAWEKHPFRSLDDLHRTMVNVVRGAGEAQQIALISAHPDLVGRAALSGELTPASTREQASAGLNRLAPDEITRFRELNGAYRDKFGFPFVICARENKKDAILTGFAARLGNSREVEVATGLVEIGKIARLRLEDLIKR